MGQLRQRSVLATIDRLFRTGTAAGLSDAQLMERFATRHGEAAEAAFAALLERHGPMVLRVCRRVLNDPHDAQDAFQATFLILVRRPGAVRQRASLASWLYGVALRVAAHSRAASARRRAVEQAAGTRLCAGPVPDEDRHELWEEVDRLPERYRVAIVLCYLEGMTHEQAASRLGWPVGTVRSRLARARERLRGRLVKRGLAPGATVLAVLVSSADASALPLSLLEPTIKAAMLVAAHDAAEAGLVSASAAALTHGVLRTMFFAKLKWTALTLITAATVAAGAGVYGYQAPQPVPRPAPVVTEKAADESGAPVAESVASDDSEDSRREQKRTANRLGVDPLSANRFAEKIADLTRAAQGRQDMGEFRQAANMVRAIEQLASDWEGFLRKVDRDAAAARSERDGNQPAESSRTRPNASRNEPLAPSPVKPSPARTRKPIAQPPDPPLPPPVADGIRPRTTPLPAPASDTDRRLADVEKKLERVLRALEDESQHRPVLEPNEFGEPKVKPAPLFKKKKAPVYTYPKRTEVEAEPGDSANPFAPPLPAARPLPPEPPKPPYRLLPPGASQPPDRPLAPEPPQPPAGRDGEN
jgi:RNA polymerase sigma factor (sigma-70 family)